MVYDRNIDQVLVRSSKQYSVNKSEASLVILEKKVRRSEERDATRINTLYHISLLEVDSAYHTLLLMVYACDQALLELYQAFSASDPTSWLSRDLLGSIYRLSTPLGYHHSLIYS